MFPHAWYCIQYADARAIWTSTAEASAHYSTLIKAVLKGH